MTRRIWHCIKRHLRPYSTHPNLLCWQIIRKDVFGEWNRVNAAWNKKTMTGGAWKPLLFCMAMVFGWKHVLCWSRWVVDWKSSLTNRMIDIQANFLAVCKGLLPEVWGYAYFWYIFILKCPEVYLQNFKSALRFALGRFEITGPITPWIVLHSVQLLLLIVDCKNR